VSSQIHTPDALPPGKEPPVPSEQEGGWDQSWPEHRGKEKNPCTFWELNPSCMAHNLVTILSYLSSLQRKNKGEEKHLATA